jgi:hypothetical protein
MLVRTGIGFQSVTALLAVADELAALIALTVTVLLAGTVAGAVNVPDALIVPLAALPPVTPFTCHVTGVFDVPDTVALKVWVALARTSAPAGEIFTLTPDPGAGVLEFEPEELVVVPVHPESNATASRRESTGVESGSTNFLRLFIIGDRKGGVPNRTSRPTTMPEGKGRDNCTQGQNQKWDIRAGDREAIAGIFRILSFLLCALRVLCGESLLARTKCGYHRGHR